jgi:hypothetical protein
VATQRDKQAHVAVPAEEHPQVVVDPDGPSVTEVALSLCVRSSGSVGSIVKRREAARRSSARGGFNFLALASRAMGDILEGTWRNGFHRGVPDVID